MRYLFSSLAMYRLVLIVKCSDAPRFTVLLTPCPGPSTPANEEDAPLWDLPSSPALVPSQDLHAPTLTCPFTLLVHTALHNIGITCLDAAYAVCQLKAQLHPIWVQMQPWVYWKFVEEPDFGPGPPIHTIFFMTDLKMESALPSGMGQWFNSGGAWDLLMAGGNTGTLRIGPLATYTFSPHFPLGLQHRLKLNLKAQEYPPGVLMIPLKSSTLKPFSKTNLVVFSSRSTPDQSAISAVKGEALIVDPGCHPIDAQKQLSKTVKALPKKLLVFLTHHHFDHTEGLPTVYNESPEAVVLAHELTLHKLGKVAGKLKCFPVLDGTLLLVGNEELRVIAAPGHTDGHMALLHVSSHALIVGDHCVGQGSSVLDAASGGNMQDYLTTTRKFLDLAPRVIIPMHGRFNMWPAHMLRGYIRHREAREVEILRCINQGARTAFEIVSQAYADSPPFVWMAALSNVKLHVDHLNQLQLLPQAFSVTSFQKSCGWKFSLRCLSHSSLKRVEAVFQRGHCMRKVPVAAAVLGFVCFFWMRR